MTRPKGKLFALLAIFMAIGIVTATGAFTSVTATRTANAEVTGDASALMQLQPSDTDNGYNPAGGGVANDPSTTDWTSEGYADIEDSELRINLAGFTSDTADTDGQVNYNATTTYNNVFNITNNGESTVTLYLTRSGDNPTTVNFHNGSAYDATTNITGSSNSMSLAPGNTVDVYIEVDTDGAESTTGTSLIDTFTVHANAQ